MLQPPHGTSTVDTPGKSHGAQDLFKMILAVAQPQTLLTNTLVEVEPRLYSFRGTAQENRIIRVV